MLACFLVCLLSAGDPAFAQQAATPPSPAPTAPALAPDAASAAATATAGAPPSPNTLLDGTAVKLRLAENLTSATAKAGQQVSFEVIDEVDVSGVPVILKGAQALATVTDATPRRSMGRGGKLDVNVDSARLVDGEKVQLRAVRDAKGGGHVGAMTGAMVATAIVFFPAAPLFLFIHGKDITIPEGTEVTAFVQGDMKLDMAKMIPPTPVGPATVAAAYAGAQGAGAPGATAPADSASLTVDSSVPNCDIEVDGEFVGNTPSVVTVAAGKHQVVVKKAGFQDWTRSMTFGGGTVRLNAEMVGK